MKRFVLLTALLAIVSGCVKRPEPKPDPIVTERLTTIEEFSVPTKSGYTTIVTLGSDTLCVAVEPTAIWIPKNTPVYTKAGEGVTVSYIEGTDPAAGTAQIWQTVGFEDSTVGDYDYNDLVIHCKYEIKTISRSDHKLGVGVHPIALGSTKNIALGCKIFINDVLAYDKVLSTNCRKDLFADQTGFINTGVTPNFHTNFFKAKSTFDLGECSNLANVKVVWYIIVGGNTYLYSVNDKYGYLDEGKRPYGIIVTNTGRSFYQDENNPAVGANWFPYPFEGVDMNTAYPTFNDWIEGRAEYCDMSVSVPNKSIEPGTYCFDRPDIGLTRVYYAPTSIKTF